MIPRRLEWSALAAVLLVYLALAGAYAIRTPDWQAPDEPAHYNYVRQIVTMAICRCWSWATGTSRTRTR